MAKPITSDYIFDLPTVGQASISPDGGQVAYVRTDVDREAMKSSSHLELVSTAGGAVRALTAGDGDGTPRWSPDGTRLAFLRRVSDGDKQKPAQVWVLPLEDGGEARQITDIDGGVTSLAWMPSGAQLVVTANVDPDATDEEGPHVQRVERIYYRADGIGWRGNAHRQLFMVAADGSGSRQLTRGDHDASSATPSPDGRRIAFFSTDRSARRQLKLPGAFELCTVAASGGRVERLVRNLQGSGSIAWSPDGRELAYVANGEDQYNHLWAVRSRGGEPRRLTTDAVMPSGAGFPLMDGPPLVWHRRRITFLASERGSSGIYSVAASGGRLQRLRTEPELITDFSSTPDGSRFSLTSSSLRRPPEVATHEAATGDSQRLTEVSRLYLRDHHVSRTERFTVTRDLDTDCWLTFPRGFDRRRRYPLILVIHGGPNGFYGNGWMPSVQALAAQGYLVLWTNPRGSSGYGADFMTRVFEDWGGEDYEDLMAAVDRVERRPYVDRRRLGVTGYSYGGFMTSWVIGHTTRFKSAIVSAPVTNLVSMYGTTDIAVGFGERQWGGPPWTNLEEYAKHSPITYAANVETPVLLLHGEADIRCPIAQSEEYYVALKRMGKQVEFVRFPGGYHGFPNSAHPRMREAFVEEQLAWWKRTL